LDLAGDGVFLYGGVREEEAAEGRVNMKSSSHDSAGVGAVEIEDGM
jgi:hypothetical protein